MPTLEWIGKEKVINHHQDVPYRVLERQYSFDADGQHAEDNGSENMIIRGDNLEALKALLPRYEGRVKCIYIDPPYNTGNEGWVYNDNVSDPKIRTWLGEVVGREGEDLTRHDKWLCMMYPRLKLLQKLLADDGAIFISIDDTEFANLRLICDEIFGIRNFLADVIWEKSDSPRMDAKIFSSRHDHTLSYSKNIDTLVFHRIHTNEIPEHYNKIEADGRRYYLKPLRAMGQNDAREARPNLYYALVAPDGTNVFPVRTDGSDGNWRWSKQKVMDNPLRIEWVKGRNGWTPYYKIYAEEQAERPPETIWYNKDVGSNRTSMNQIKAAVTNAELSTESLQEICSFLITRLKAIPTGPDDATDYHRTMVGVLELLFYPHLCNPVIEHEIHEGRKRIDIVFDNCSESGFFFRLFNTHGIPSRFIMVECKNYTRDVKNPEIDQIGGRFSSSRGQMGIIACRSVDDMQTLINRCGDTYNDGRGLIIPMVDDDFCEMLQYRAAKNDQAIDDFVQKRFHQIASR